MWERGDSYMYVSTVFNCGTRTWTWVETKSLIQHLEGRRGWETSGAKTWLGRNTELVEWQLWCTHRPERKCCGRAVGAKAELYADRL